MMVSKQAEGSLSKQSKNWRIVVVGTLPPPICGTTVLVEQLIHQLEEHEQVNVAVIETGSIRGNGLLGIFKFAKVILSIFMESIRADGITMHLNPLAFSKLGPFAVTFCWIFRTTLIVRLFGGQDFRDFKGLNSTLFKWVANHATYYLAETHRLIDSAKQAGIKNIVWYPNSRPRPKTEIRKRERCRRFVFAGLVKPSKGVPLMLEIQDKLPTDVTIDVYGPFFDGMSETDFRTDSSVRYCGIIPSGGAIDKFQDYDALILPTHWEGEGHPGVILEAYHAGIPVITTNWRDIPEIVDEESGILISPKAPNELLAAIVDLVENDTYYASLCEGAATKSLEFSASRWTQKLVDLVIEANEQRN